MREFRADCPACVREAEDRAAWERGRRGRVVRYALLDVLRWPDEGG